MVKDITSAEEFNREIRVPNLVVVDFYATWCGPCKMIAPFIEQLQTKYPEVVFLKVADHNCQDLIMSLGVTAFPTFHFYVNGAKIDELRGADSKTLESKVNQHKVNVGFSGSGQKLGATPAWDGVGMPPGNARDARLKAFGNVEGKAPSQPKPQSAPQPTPPSSTPMVIDDEDDEEEALAMAIALSKANKASSGEAKKSARDISVEAQDKQDQADAEAAMAAEESNNADGWDEEMVPVPVDEGILQELIEMGFSDIRSRKGIVHGKDLEGALVWLTEHLEDADIDQPYMVRKRDTIPKVPLTEEEKAQRVAALKLKFKLRREEKGRLEKAEALKSEKERRERGQKMENVAEERERMQRKREAEKIKREKEEAKREKERLLAEIALDKAARAKNKGVLPSVLGVDGYNPSIIQYDQPSTGPTPSAPGGPGASTSTSSGSASAAAMGKSSAGGSASSSSSAETKAETKSSAVDADAAERTVDSAISTIMRYRTAGDGGQALKLLLTFVKNVADSPDEPKYRSINMESKAFKSKFANILGPLPLLKALGFERVESSTGESKLAIDSVNLRLFQSTVAKLTQAEQTYLKMNS